VANHQITCTRQEPLSLPHSAAHIVIVGSGGHLRWTVNQVYLAMDLGDGFYTVGPVSGKVAWVNKHTCQCGRRTLRTGPDGAWDNNLDQLPACL